jgi:tRNA threonylcarbamoyl adenosine modification protein YeaZ
MLLLALDTASPSVSVAVHDGDRVLARHNAGGSPRHAELLTPAVEQVLAELFMTPSELTAIAVGAGPGPFTGLRVGLATASVMGLALGIPVSGVCSLDAVAAGAIREGMTAPEFLVAIDARRKEVYWARYRIAATGLPVREGDPKVGPAAGIDVAGLPVAGRGAWLYPEELGQPALPLDPDAGDLAGLAVAGAPYVIPPQPLYLRRPDAKVPGARKRVRP